MRVKALSVRQPWADLIASGRKTIETRRRRTSHRGAILICAPRGSATETPGMALALARLVDCRPMTDEDEDRACTSVYTGAWSWVLEDVRRIRPFEVRGMPGLFSVDYDPRTPHSPKALAST